MRNIKTLTVLFGLLALFSGAYTLPAKEQKDDNKEVKALMDLLAEVQDDENESDGDLSALLQTEDDEGSEQEDDDGNIILALLQDEEEGDDGAVTQEDSDEADTQRRFGRIFRGIRHVRGICKKLSRYSRYLNYFTRMYAEMQEADDGDEELAKNLLKRIANAQEDDAEAQFFRRLFRKVRSKRFFKKIRRGVGRFYRCCKNIKRCIRRLG